MTENLTPAQFSYDQALKRITDLNRVSFNYRFLFVSVIAAYFTGASFFLKDGIRSNLPLSFEFGLLILFAISVLALAGIVTIAFFDFIFQELIESALAAAATIESTHDGLDAGFRLLSRRGGRTISFRISIAMSLLYFVPIAALFLIVGALAAVHLAPPLTGIPHFFADSLCQSQDWTNVRGLTCPPLGFASYEFLILTKSLVSAGQFFSLGLFGYFVIFVGWRCFSRFYLSCWSHVDEALYLSELNPEDRAKDERETAVMRGLSRPDDLFFPNREILIIARKSERMSHATLARPLSIFLGYEKKVYLHGRYEAQRIVRRKITRVFRAISWAFGLICVIMVFLIFFWPAGIEFWYHVFGLFQ